MFAALLQRLLDKQPKQSRELTVPELSALFRTAIQIPQVCVITRRNAGVDLDYVSVGGCYDKELDLEGEPCVEISLIYNPEQQHISTGNIDWGRTCLDIAECIGHEFVHRDQQKRKRPPSVRYRGTALDKQTKQEQEYLGTNEEIEAYGFSIAAELVALHRCYELDLELVPQVMMYAVYARTFDTDQSVMLKLHRQISKYLRRLEVDYHDKNNSRQRPRTRRSRSTGRRGRRT